MSTPTPNINPATLGRLAVLVGFVGAYAALVLAAAAGEDGIYFALLVVTILLDLYTETREQWLRTLLRLAQLSLSIRGVLLTATLALLLVRHFSSWGDGRLLVVVSLVIALPLSRSMFLGVLGILRTASTRPLGTRNIDLGALTDPRPPPRWLTYRVDRKLVLLGHAPLLIGGLSVLIDTDIPLIVASLAYVLAMVTGMVYLGVQVLRFLRLPGHDAWERKAFRRVRDLDAQVVLYFSGPGDSTYQIDMWLETFEKLPHRTVVLLREWHVLETLAPTTLPVVCIPSGVSVMQAGLSSARVALYPANTSKNLHMLREPGLKHVFIGHGDSDKVSSINPFTRVYDEVWVAGRAGRDRWARAGVGVRDEAIVEVGRPQLDSVHLAGFAPRTEPLTVMYAPTWEGWNDDTFFSSITQIGPRLMRALLDLTPAVRIIYKPHPFTGARDRRALRSHDRIVQMLTEANNAPSRLPSDTRLQEIEDRLKSPDLSVAESRELSETWASHYWTVLGPQRHAVVSGPRPTLYDSFDHADVLFADVSSVVSDFLASGKPYVCINTEGLDAAAFRDANPTAAAAYLLSPDCHEVPEIIELVRGADPMEPDRATLREYLLGADEPRSLTRWQAALDALMVDGPGDRTARAVGADESVLEEVDETVLEEVDDPEHASSSDSPTG